MNSKNPKTKKIEAGELEDTIRNIRYYCDVIWNAGLQKQAWKLVKYKNEIEERIRLLITLTNGKPKK